MSCPTAPGVRHAVATLTAPSTPMDLWQRCGMNVRVETAPPCMAGETMVIFGTDRSDTSDRFIKGPASKRIFSNRARKASSASSSVGDSVPEIPISPAFRTTHGIPLSIIVTVTPSTTSATFPVGNSAPQVDPADPQLRDAGTDDGEQRADEEHALGEHHRPLGLGRQVGVARQRQQAADHAEAE